MIADVPNWERLDYTTRHGCCSIAVRTCSIGCPGLFMSGIPGIAIISLLSFCFFRALPGSRGSSNGISCGGGFIVPTSAFWKMPRISSLWSGMFSASRISRAFASSSSLDSLNRIYRFKTSQYLRALSIPSAMTILFLSSPRSSRVNCRFLPGVIAVLVEALMLAIVYPLTVFPASRDQTNQNRQKIMWCCSLSLLWKSLVRAGGGEKQGKSALDGNLRQQYAVSFTFSHGMHALPNITRRGYFYFFTASASRMGLPRKALRCRWVNLCRSY